MAKGSSLFGLMIVRNIFISLRQYLVLLEPSFEKEFKLVVDASVIGAGSLLCYIKMTIVTVLLVTIHKMFNKHQRNYSTIEKECLSLIIALQHF